MSLRQAWHTASLLHISYLVDQEPVFVTQQFIETPVKLDGLLGTEVNEQIRAAARGVIESNLFKRLSAAEENYGILGFQNWVVEVLGITVKPIVVQELELAGGENV